MAAIDNLNTALQRIQTDVNAAIVLLNTPHATDAQVQTAADTLNSVATALEAVTNPTPTPVPTPSPTGT